MQEVVGLEEPQVAGEAGVPVTKGGRQLLVWGEGGGDGGPRAGGGREALGGESSGGEGEGGGREIAARRIPSQILKFPLAPSIRQVSPAVRPS